MCYAELAKYMLIRHFRWRCGVNLTCVIALTIIWWIFFVSFWIPGSPPTTQYIMYTLTDKAHTLYFFPLIISLMLKFIFILYFYSTSIILISFNFDIRWDVTIEKCRCVMLSLENTCLLNILKLYWVFLIKCNLLVK